MSAIDALIRQAAGRTVEPENRLEAAARRSGSYLSGDDVSVLTGLGPNASDADLDRALAKLRREVPAAFERSDLAADLGGRGRAHEGLGTGVAGSHPNATVEADVDSLIRRAAGR